MIPHEPLKLISSHEKKLQVWEGFVQAVSRLYNVLPPLILKSDKFKCLDRQTFQSVKRYV